MTEVEEAPAAASGSAPQSPARAPYRLMVVDDSAVIRGLIIRAFELDPEITVVASASNGEMALNALERHDVEIVVLDIEMPVMDGLTALPRLLAAKPGLKVIIASTLTRRGADITMRALAAGAADYLTKPAISVIIGADEFTRELVAKVKALGESSRGIIALKHLRARPPALRRTEELAPDHPLRRVIALRPMSRDLPEAVAIGSSTGGPQALFRVLGALRGAVSQPIFITQHMPATFTAILAEHIGRASGFFATEATDGEPVRAGQVYIAPGDFHMTVEQTAPGQRVVRIGQGPPENFCRPSVDPMLRSLAAAYGPRLLCLMLTGMGKDGLGGSKAVVEAGGTVIAQDEATSVVWGMPGSVAQAGLCSAVLPLGEIGPFVCRMVARGPR